MLGIDRLTSDERVAISAKLVALFRSVEDYVAASFTRGRRNLLEPIKAALGPERSMVFLELVNALDIGPYDRQLVVASAVASFIVSLTEWRAWIESLVARVEAMFSKFLAMVDLKIAEAFTRGADEFQTELRLAAREAAYSEYRAVAVLRSQAIAEEVAALAAAANELARLKAELQAERSVRAAPPSRAGGFLSPTGFALVAAAFVLGWGLALFMTRPAPRQADLSRPAVRVVAASSMRSVNVGRPFSKTV